MTIPDSTDRIIAQGRALVRAIEALGTIDPSGPVEPAAARLLLYAYERRVRRGRYRPQGWHGLGSLLHYHELCCRKLTPRAEHQQYAPSGRLLYDPGSGQLRHRERTDWLIANSI